MSYRDTSNYEPFGTLNQGRPLRPFNWVQWTGVALAAFGLAADLLYLAGSLGLTHEWLKSPGLAFPPIILGMLLVNSRREAIPDLAPELAGKRRRSLLIVTLIVVVLIGAATVIEILGA